MLKGIEHIEYSHSGKNLGISMCYLLQSRYVYIYIIIVICICLYLCLYDVYKICPSNSKLGSIFSKFYKVGMGQTGQNWYPLVNKLENGPVEIVDLPIKSSVIFHSFLYVYQRDPEGISMWIHMNGPCSSIFHVNRLPEGNPKNDLLDPNHEIFCSRGKI